MTITKNNNGSWCVSKIIDGYLINRVYFFYTKKEALQLFKQEFNI